MNRRTILSASFLVAVAAVLGVQGLWTARLWPFATGTHDLAFLSTTFEMSPQEVRRSLARHGAQLLRYEEYRRADTSPLIQVFGTPVLFEDLARETSLFMPGIEMFQSRVEGEFGFTNDRLRWVSVYFDPLSRSETQAIVGSIHKTLRNTYEFAGREESEEVPGAYTLRFSSTTATPSLWVNLTDPGRPIVILTVLNAKMQDDRMREIEARQRSSFGQKR